MAQTGARGRLPNRHWEDYQSMHKATRTIGKSSIKAKGVDSVNEIQYNQKIATGGAGASLRCLNLCGLTSGEGAGNYSIVGIGKTETNLQVKSSAADAGLAGAVITAHYLDQDLVAHTATIASAIADMSGVVDFDTPVTDFYCWDTETYGTSCFTSSIAVGGGLTLDAGAAGTGYAQIIATAKVGTKLSYIGVGTVYGLTAANQADAGVIGTLDYKNPIGRARSVTWTIPADGTVVTAFLDANGFPVQDYYKADAFYMDTLSADQYYIGNAAAVVDAGAAGLIYCAMETLHWSAEFAEYFSFGSNYGRSFIGDVEVTYGLCTESVTLTLTYHKKGDPFPTTISWDIQGCKGGSKPICVELEPLSSVTLLINDDAGTGGNANVQIRYIEVAYE